MYYQTITIGTKPGVRLQAIEGMKKYAAWAKEKYDVPTQVLGNMAGNVYENHIVQTFASLDQMHKFGEEQGQDPEFSQWFEENKDVLDWKTARINLFNVL
jgi:hypothetical protein